MAEQRVKVTIDGELMNDHEELILEQGIYDHHFFQVAIKHQRVEELSAHTLDKTKAWLGKSIIIGLGDYDFTGLITSVNMVHNHENFGDVVVSGYSKSIMLESAPHRFSWIDTTLRDVIAKVGESASDLQLVNKPKYSGDILYMAQYNESNFAFMRRLAVQFHEWFYYDGEKMLFGEPGSMPTVPVIYGKDAKNIQVGMNIKSVKYDRLDYAPDREEFMTGKTQDSVPGLDDFGNHAFGIAKKTFNFNGVEHTAPIATDKGSLDDDLKNLQSAAAADLSVVQGQSTKRELRPGVILDLKTEYMKDGSKQSKSYGTYLVISVNHYSDEIMEYRNTFRAIPSGVKILPTPTIELPQGYSEVARVISNADPDELGRVQVQTQWQQTCGLNTNWIRVMAPTAGSSKYNGSNCGYVMIPEMEDEVKIGYEYGDPSRPYVLGSVFHGNNGTGGGANNSIKSIITRSGHMLVFDDSTGGEKITLTDRNGNVLSIDTQSDAINIVSNSEINLRSKNINLDASETIKFEAKDIKGLAGDKIALTADCNIQVSAGETINLDADKTLVARAGKDIKLDAGGSAKIDLNEKGVAKMQSDKTAVISSKDAEVTGKSKIAIRAKKTFMEGSSKAIVKGNMVDIS